MNAQAELFQEQKKQINLRDYQRHAADAIVESFKDNDSALVVMPTGCGKTVLFSEIINRFQPNKAMVIAHREELIFQAKEKIERCTGLKSNIEMGQFRADTNWGLFGMSQVVISTVQTQNSGDRLLNFKPEDFGLLVIDEAHHCTSPTYRKIIDYYRQNPRLKVLGVTATPDRADEEALGQIFETVAFDYEILDAIKDGWLVPVEQQMVEVDGLDFSSVRTTAGDLNGADLAEIMEFEKNLHGIADPTIKIVGDRRTLVFTASVAQAERLCEIFNRHRAGCSAFVCGKTQKDDRRRIISDFDHGKIQFMVNCGVFTEGWDDKAIDEMGVQVIAIARPTKSRALYAQMCVDSETEILTNRRWLKIDDQLGDEEKIAAFNLDGSVEYQKCLQKIKRQILPDEYFVSLQNPHLDIRVTNGHDMVVSRRTTLKGKKIKTSLEKIRAEDVLNIYNPNIPICGNQKSDGLDIKDCELRFIGLVMTDGNINFTNNQITLYQSERHKFCVEYFEKTINDCGFKFGHTIDKKPTNFGERSPLHRWTISKGKPRGRDKNKKGWGYLEKYLIDDWPEDFEKLTRLQLLVLLEAMDIGDGCKKLGCNYKSKTLTICTVNKFLSDKIQSICVRRGMRCNIGLGGTNRNMFLLHISPDRKFWTFTTSASDNRVIAQKEFCQNEMVWCVTVPSGMIITRRNNKVSIMGNCGRGLRPLPGVVDGHELDTPENRLLSISSSNKSSCLIIDYVGNSGRHKLMSTADILGGNVSDEVIELAKKKARENGRAMRMDEALQESQEEIEKEKERKRLAEEARRAKLLAKAKYTSKNVDPFDVFQLTPQQDRGWHKGKVLSDKQKDMLMKQGINPEGMNYASAKQLLTEVFRRFNNKECSFKQQKILIKFGIKCNNMPYEKASRIIDSIARNGWRRTAEVDSMLSV